MIGEITPEQMAKMTAEVNNFNSSVLNTESLKRHEHVTDFLITMFSSKRKWQMMISRRYERNSQKKRSTTLRWRSQLVRQQIFLNVANV
jgi:hypothetical protein